MIQLHFCMKVHARINVGFSSSAAETARPIKGPDERLTQRAQLHSPIQTLTYAAAVTGCSRHEGQADGGWPRMVATVVCVYLCVYICVMMGRRQRAVLILEASVC